MELTPDQLVLAAAVAAVVVGIYLLRHVIVLAFRLVVLAVVVLALVWVWQHRGDLADAAEPLLGPVGDRLEGLDLSFVRGVLTDLLSDGDGVADGNGAQTGDGGVTDSASTSTAGGAVEPIVEPDAAEGTETAAETAEEPRDRGDPNAPE